MGTKVSSSKNNFAFSDNEYGFITLSAQQSTGLSDKNPIKFDTLSDGNVTFDSANYRVTLKKNRTYMMRATPFIDFTANTGLTDFQFYDVTNGALVGQKGRAITLDFGGHVGTKPQCNYTVTPTVDTVFEVRLVSPSSVNAVYNTWSVWEIQQINIVSPVIQTPYLMNSIPYDLTVTLANWTTTWAKGWYYTDKSGSHKLQFNIVGVMSSGARTGITLAITGVTFKNSGSWQSISGNSGVVAPISYCIASANTGNIEIYHTLATTTSYAFSGDVVLESKPTWL